MEKVSIIVPVYNAQKYITRCVQSILEQDYQNIELILVDDGSKDDSPMILDDIALSDSRVKVIHKPNGGVSSTRNRGIAEATGRYIQFVDADDYITKETTKLLVRSIEADSSDMVIGDFYRIAGDLKSCKGSIPKSGLITRRKYTDSMMHSPADLYYGVLWNKLYRHSIIEEHHIRMDENISMSEDMIFNLEYLLHVSTISVITVPVYNYVMTPGSLVAQNTNIPKIIEMKTNVISYYNKFYKEILSPADYIERIPIIYGYLIAVSTDSLAFNFFKKKESPVTISPSRDSHSLLLDNFLLEALIDKHLCTFGRKHSLETKECRILYLMNLYERPMNISQLSFLMESSFVNTGISIGKLLSLKYIKREYIHRYDAFADSYSIADEKITQDMDFIEQDILRIAFKGMSHDKISAFAEMQKEIVSNITSNLTES